MKNILCIFFLLMPFIGSSQVIKGSVYDEEGAPVEFASVRLFNVEDSTVSNGGFTNSAGEYELKNIEFGSYYLKITFSGFDPYQINDIRIDSKTTLVDLERTQLTVPKTLEIDGTTVIGSLDALRAGIDKKIYKVEDDISVQGGSANDVLNNVPSVDIDEEGNISLRGDGNVTILVDGRPSALALGDGQNLLDAIPANSIDRIEIVTNPSAKYDPDGTSGIINIVLKKEGKRGKNGLMSLTGGTGKTAEVSTGFSYRTPKWNIYLNYTLKYFEGSRNNFRQLYQVYSMDSSTFLDQSREGTDFKLNQSFIFGTDYHIDDRNVIGLAATISHGARERTGNLYSTLSDFDSIVIDNWNRVSVDPRMNINYDVNLNYTHTLKANRGEWSVMGNQSMGSHDIRGIYEEYSLDENDLPNGLSPVLQNLYNDRINKVTTVQGDASYIFDSIRARIEGGLKYLDRYELNNTLSELADTLTGIYNPDTAQSFNYQYDEQIFSGYGIFGQELGNLKYQVGVRGEIAKQNPQLLTDEIEYSKTYLNIYPSGHIKYEIGKKSEFSFSYSKRINRPRSRQLNPFRSYSNPLSVRTGNPDLNPEYIDSYDFGYSYGGKSFILTTSIYHKRTRDVIQRVNIYEGNAAVGTYLNVDNSIISGLEIITIIKPFKGFKNTISFNGSMVEFIDDSEELNWNNKGVNWGVKYNGSIEFWKRTTTFQLNAQYRAPMVTAQGVYLRRPGINLSVERRFLDKRLRIGMRVTDVFNNQGFYFEVNQPDVWQVSEYKWLTRRFYISCSYRFGKYEDKKPSHQIDGGGEM